MNIPIYRAKKIDSNEYVEGFYYTTVSDKTHQIFKEWFIKEKLSMGEEYQRLNQLNCEVDPTTLSIHFPDMLDSEGKKIFASLSEDGKGGDIMSYEPAPKETDLNGVVTYERGRISIDKEGFMPKFKLLKVTGIKD